jgi:hypothetical protein
MQILKELVKAINNISTPMNKDAEEEKLIEINGKKYKLMVER